MALRSWLTTPRRPKPVSQLVEGGWGGALRLHRPTRGGSCPLISRYDAVRRTAARQHGLIRRSQLYELGIPSGSLDHAISVGHLERLSARVLRVGGSARTLDQV